MAKIMSWDIPLIKLSKLSTISSKNMIPITITYWIARRSKSLSITLCFTWVKIITLTNYKSSNLSSPWTRTMMENSAGRNWKMHSREPTGFSIDSLGSVNHKFNIKMSYHLEDPYRYLPKCFPFIDPQRPYSAQYHSSRLTQRNRQIQGKMIEMKQDYLSRVHDQNQNNEINLLRVRTLAQSLNKKGCEDLSDARCQIYGARKNKQNNLRRNSHAFPDFIKSKHLLAETSSN